MARDTTNISDTPLSERDKKILDLFKKAIPVLDDFELGQIYATCLLAIGRDEAYQQ